MPLGCANLAEPAQALREHWIVVAQSIPPYPAMCCLLDQISQLEVVISGSRSASGRNGKRNRPAVDNRRRATARRTVETLAAENNSHAKPIANYRKVPIRDGLASRLRQPRKPQSLPERLEPPRAVLFGLPFPAP